MRIILWDIESMGFNADWDNLLCVGWKILGQKKVYCPKISDFDAYKEDYNDDGPLLRHVAPVLSEADMWITHNGKRFDVPFFNSRLVRLGLPPLPPTAHVDTYNSIARHGLKVSSRRLGALADFLGVEEGKESLGMGPWKELRRGTRKGRDSILNKIAEYCKQDVRCLEAVYDRLKVLYSAGPSLAVEAGQCPRCGIFETLQRRGYNIRQTGRDQRFQCQACGGWSRAPINPKTGKVGRIR